MIHQHDEQELKEPPALFMTHHHRLLVDQR